MIRFPSLRPAAAFAAILPLALAAQSYVAWTDVPLTREGAPLAQAWAGGLNCPQFSRADLDGDGIDDLFVFDRRGDVALAFRHDGAGGIDGYAWAPDLQRHYPRAYGWAILRDLDCDGAEELITSSEGLYVSVYPGYRTASGELRFTPDTARLAYERAGIELYLGVTAIDIPAFEDVDGDGDLDVLTFNLGGGYVEWLRNRAAENGDPCGPLDLVYADSCWGGFYESGIAPSVDLGACGPGRPSAEGRASGRGGIHAGSTFAAFDAEGDGDLDLILGDLSFSHLVYLENGGTPEVADMVFQDPDFPSSDVTYEVNQFPAPFVIDLDRDGVEDLVAAPNSEVQGRGVDQVWYYRNEAASGMADFRLQAEDFLVGDMADFGHGAAAAFFDHNGDGLLDLVVGNEGYLPGIGAKTSRLALLENTGTAGAPAFELVDDDYAGLSIYGFVALHPTFGDVDGDGDEDLIVGEEEGLLHWFANNPSGGVASFSLLAPGWQGIDVGKTATPHLVDLDRDGDLDLLIGERNGNINHWRNEGSPTAASMVLATEVFGDIAPVSGLTNVGFSQPWVVEDPDGGDYLLYVGSLNGRIWRYDDWEADLSAAFPPADSAVGGIDDGDRSRVAVADLDADGRLDLVAGNLRGGLVLYREGSYPSAVAPVPALPLRLYPNPARDRAVLETGLEGPWRLVVRDLTGRLRAERNGAGPRAEVATADWPEGLYLLTLTAPDGRRATARLLVAGR